MGIWTVALANGARVSPVIRQSARSTVVYYLPAIINGAALSSILLAVTVAILFTPIYHFNTGIIGLMLGVPLLVGSALGDFSSGPLSDWFVYRYAKHHGGHGTPESRLPALLGSLLFRPAGIIILWRLSPETNTLDGSSQGNGYFQLRAPVGDEGVLCIRFGPLQAPGGETGSLYNFGRQTFSILMSFYALPFANKIGIDWAWIALALLCFSHAGSGDVYVAWREVEEAIGTTKLS